MRRSIGWALAVLAVAGGLGGASCDVADVRVLEDGAEAGAIAPTADTGVACGRRGSPCCDGGCVEDASFCSIDRSCRSARPTDVGAPCTSGADCQSGECTYVQAFDAGTGAHARSPTVCSGPCWGQSDCLAGWTCLTQGPLVTAATGPGTCLCAPVPETCDGRDHNCDGVIDEEPGASAACTAANGVPSKCVGGACMCTHQCDGGCVDLNDDPKNCGACGRTCAPGIQVCANSQCVCGGTLCPLATGGPGDAGNVVADGGPDGGPAACVDVQSDPNNCGGCGIVCAYTCAAGCVPLLLAPLPVDTDAATVGSGGPAVASSGSKLVVLTAANGGVIEECDVEGCNPSPIPVAWGLDNVNNSGTAGLLALGGSWAYWPGQSAVNDVAITDATVSTFSRAANASVVAVATNATQVFWSDANLGIWSCAIGATCASPTSRVPASGLAAAPQAIAADESYFYWMDASGEVFSAPLAGGPSVSLERGNDFGAGFVVAMVASGGRVYYADAATGQLMMATGGVAASATVYSTDTPVALAADGVSLYWSNGVAIHKCALGAACASSTWIYGTTATSVALDAANLYWIDSASTTQGAPRIWKFHK